MCVLCIQVNYFQPTELLRVRIVRGEKLGKRDLFGACDPYVVVKLEGQDGEVIDEITLEKKRKVGLFKFLLRFFF